MRKLLLLATLLIHHYLFIFSSGKLQNPLLETFDISNWNRIVQIQCCSLPPRLRNLFMLNSAEHDIQSVHKCYNALLAFDLLITVKIGIRRLLAFDVL